MRATLRKYDAEKRLVELSLITCADGADDSPLEILEDGTATRVKTAAEVEAAEQAAEAAAAAAVAATDAADAAEA